MIKYNELTIDNMLVIANKALAKKDGCYTLRGILYRVRNNRVTHYAYKGIIVEVFGNFTVQVGEYKYQLSDGMKQMKGI